MIYSVRDWGNLYENHETRKRKFLGWVLVPNKHDSLAYCTIMSRPDGLQVFGAWNLILQCASRCTERGKLVSDTGKPYSPQDIATKTRAKVSEIENALVVLVEVGWLSVERLPAASGGSSAAKAARPADKAAPSAGKAARPAVFPAASKEVSKKESKTPLTPQTLLANDAKKGGFIPKDLQDDEFEKMWRVWLEHNEEKGKPLTMTCQRAQLAELSPSGPAQAVKQLQTAIVRNWQGPAMVDKQTPAPLNQKALPVESLQAEVERLAREN